ncbi:MAG: hypothetical protein JSR57_10685, partial [Verrucomicrobia bacterium]|nr:hypothetical protein [Verrucomicrobiota bacterium]
MSDSKFLLLLSQQGKSFKPINEKLKGLGAFYNGIGYAVPQKNEVILKQLVENLPDAKIIPMPLQQGQTFESYQISYKAAFFEERLIEVEDKLLLWRESFNFDDVDDSIVASSKILTDEQKEEIVDLLHQKEKLQGQLAWAKGMEKTLQAQQVSKISIEKQLELEQEETAEIFLTNHKETFSRGILLAGYREMDKRLFYVPGDLVIVQGISNHGKSKWMGQKAYNFLTSNRNIEKNPVCAFISFENSPLFVKQDFLNMISKHQDEGERFIAFDPSYSENGEVESPFLYPDLAKDFL